MSGSYKSGVLVQTGLGELFEAPGKFPRQRGCRKFGDVEEDSHRMHVRVGRFTFGKLNGCDAQRPDISLEDREYTTAAVTRLYIYSTHTHTRALKTVL